MIGKRFVDIEEVKKKNDGGAAGITKDEFKKCVENRKNRLDKCINSNEEYFEGD